jgi:hypothetical protein
MTTAPGAPDDPTPLEAALADPARAVVVDPVAPEDGVDAASIPVMVAFGGLANGTDDPPFEFVRQTGELGVHRVFVRDLGQCWYQEGFPGTADGVVEAVAALRRVLDDLGPSRRVFVGNSSGAFAAVLFGVLGGADEVVAFGPLASVTRLARIRSRDRRWPAQIRAARRSARDPSHLDLRRLLRSVPHPAAITVHYGVLDPRDTHSAVRLGAVPGVEVVGHPGGHLFIRKLRDAGELQPIIAAALSPGPQG